MNEFYRNNLLGIEYYANDVEEVKVHMVKIHTSALGNKREEGGLLIKRGEQIPDRISCANTTCTSHFSIRDFIVEAVQGRRVVEVKLRCEGKEAPDRIKSPGGGCDSSLRLVVSPLFSRVE